MVGRAEDAVPPPTGAPIDTRPALPPFPAARLPASSLPPTPRSGGVATRGSVAERVAYSLGTKRGCAARAQGAA